MGGMLTVASINSKGEKTAFKMHTSSLNKLNSLDFLNEDYFYNYFNKKGFISNDSTLENEHDDYDNIKALFAPYHYGILIVDFQNKHFFSANNYSGFLNTGTFPILTDYEALGVNKQTEVEVHSKNDIVKMSIYDSDFNYWILFETPKLIESCIRLNGTMTVDNTPFKFQPNDDFFSVSSRILGIDIYQLSDEDVKKEIKKSRENLYSKNVPGGYFSINSYSNVSFNLPDWKEFNGDGSKLYITQIYDFYNEKNMLSDLEKSMWHNYLQEQE
jgi:hypothetical protein